MILRPLLAPSMVEIGEVARFQSALLSVAASALMHTEETQHVVLWKRWA